MSSGPQNTIHLKHDGGDIAPDKGMKYSAYINNVCRGKRVKVPINQKYAHVIELRHNTTHLSQEL